MTVRFFGGFDFEAEDAQEPPAREDRLHQGRADGRRFSDAPNGKAPTFLVAALKDPIGANLDRIQIIKGWLDARANCMKRSTTSPGPASRKPGADGKVPPVGNTVDVAERDLDQHDRRARTDRGVEGPGFRSGAARLLLRPGDRDPDTALDRLRREIFRRQDAAGSSHDHHRARLHLADLVHARS